MQELHTRCLRPEYTVVSATSQLAQRHVGSPATAPRKNSSKSIMLSRLPAHECFLREASHLGCTCLADDHPPACEATTLYMQTADSQQEWLTKEWATHQSHQTTGFTSTSKSAGSIARSCSQHEAQCKKGCWCVNQGAVHRVEIG